MDKESLKKKAQKSSSKARNTAARLAAVQAVYQYLSNRTPAEDLVREYVDHRFGEDVDGSEMIVPDGALFKDIILGVNDRFSDLEDLLVQNLKKRTADDTVQDAQSWIEPLLKSILLCGGYELMAGRAERGIIINDYLEATRAFYDEGETRLVNGVLDKLASGFQDKD